MISAMPALLRAASQMMACDAAHARSKRRVMDKTDPCYQFYPCALAQTGAMRLWHLRTQCAGDTR
jgi:hypothetical protein